MVKDIKSVNNRVVIVLEYQYPISGYTTELSTTYNSDVDAELRAHNLYENFFKTIEKIRKLEYESGWSDAKKKKPKRAFFYSSMTTNKYT